MSALSSHRHEPFTAPETAAQRRLAIWQATRLLRLRGKLRDAEETSWSWCTRWRVRFLLAFAILFALAMVPVFILTGLITLPLISRETLIAYQALLPAFWVLCGAWGGQCAFNSKLYRQTPVNLHLFDWDRIEQLAEGPQHHPPAPDRTSNDPFKPPVAEPERSEPPTFDAPG